MLLIEHNSNQPIIPLKAKCQTRYLENSQVTWLFLIFSAEDMKTREQRKRGFLRRILWLWNDGSDLTNFFFWTAYLLSMVESNHLFIYLYKLL